jgi:hypothetical protein
MANWLRHWATSRNTAGSIPDVVIGILHWLNPSDRTVAVRSTESLTEMSTTDISGVRRGERRPGPIVQKFWEIQPAGALWADTLKKSCKIKH